ncbi:MAG TPA: glycosyltransferase family 4 protein [Candidatus Thermoplasmatota archaeon]|nr:glycosyltransferase family 4 protein [Candidatus Thermoplasmatota archaeon]
MRICMLNPLFHPYQGGTEKVILEFGSRLARQGVDVSVLTSRLPDTPAEETVQGIRVRRSPALYLAKLPPPLPPPYTITPRFAWDILATKDADLLHLHNRYWWGPLEMWAVRSSGTPLVLTIHNARPVGISPTTDAAAGLYDDVLGHRWMELSKGIACVSQAALDATIPAALRDRARVVYNGVDTERFAPEAGAGSVRERHGIPAEAPLILSNARLIEQKGLFVLLDAFAQVRRRHPDAHLLLVGKGPLKEALQEHARKLGVEAAFAIVTGIPEDELVHHYNAADVFALPSFYEPSAVVLYEALGCGKPVVCTEVGGNTEIVSPECAVAVPPRDAARLAEGLLRVLDDDARRRAMASAARARAVSQFDWSVAARRYLEFYRELLA